MHTNVALRIARVNLNATNECASQDYLNLFDKIFRICGLRMKFVPTFAVTMTLRRFVGNNPPSYAHAICPNEKSLAKIVLNIEVDGRRSKERPK